MVASTRKFYRTVFQYEVLSEVPVESSQLEDIAYECRDGHFSGQMLSQTQETIDAKTAVKALLNQGSDPEFFQLNMDGEDIE